MIVAWIFTAIENIMDTPSVESLCNLLARSRLVVGDEVRSLRGRWLKEAGDAAADAARFGRWLVKNHYLTDYQSDLLLRGKADRFFLNEYKLLERIGVGRMAGVYKAVHRLGPTVAIKVLPPSKARDANTFARFQREGRLAMRLQHPNIVRSYQIAEDNGLHYLVMEYLEGETLADVLKRCGKLSPPEAVRLIHQALQGLDCLHEQAMVHRDLNPGNLMLVPGAGGAAKDTAEATVKILDIGLGRALFDEETAGGAEANLTADGTILGTPDYMAPEQARDSHAADVRSDIYSLGCTLFHCLAGSPPFPDSNIVRKMVRHATEPVPALKKCNPAVPDGLQQIVNWMTAKDPAQRYPTPERAAQALQVFLAARSATPAAVVNPKMRAYLDWLEVNDGAETSIPAAKPAAAPSVPPAAPVAPPAAAKNVDVELVAAMPKNESAVGWLSRRDALMLWIGAGILAAASGTALVVKRIVDRKKAKRESDDSPNE